ncbi:hypothetical protein Tco_0766740 [Tanacetum coccineum]
MQTQESKIDTGKALDANLVDTESIRTDSTVQDDNNRSGNDTDADDCRYQTHLYDRIRANGLYGKPLNGQKKGQQRIDIKWQCIIQCKAGKPQMSTEVHQAAETVTTSNELDLLSGPLFDEYLNGENQVALKSSAVTTADASDKRQQQPDSTSSTSSLATSVTADGNFDL